MTTVESKKMREAAKIASEMAKKYREDAYHYIPESMQKWAISVAMRFEERARELNAEAEALETAHAADPVVDASQPSGDGSGDVIKAVVENGAITALVVDAPLPGGTSSSPDGNPGDLDENDN